MLCVRVLLRRGICRRPPDRVQRRCRPQALPDGGAGGTAANRRGEVGVLGEAPWGNEGSVHSNAQAAVEEVVVQPAGVAEDAAESVAIGAAESAAKMSTRP